MERFPESPESPELSEEVPDTLPTPGDTRIFRKSPQELAAQMQDVSLFLKYSPISNGGELDEKYKKSKERVEELLQSGVDDKELTYELERLYEEGKNSGQYSLLGSEHGAELLRAEVQRMIDIYGYGRDEAEQSAQKKLMRHDYVASVREARLKHEEKIRDSFLGFLEANPLEPAVEKERIEKLREKCIFLDSHESVERLAPSFPGGNYLYHGTKVGQSIGIFSTGNLENVFSLHKRENERHSREGGDKKWVARNTGYEGVSWSLNEIDALPGDRYHLAGFLASPEDILSENLQLAVPSRPAPHELILIDGAIDANRYYSLKTQAELLMDVGIGECNSVLSQLIELASYHKGLAENQESYSFKPSLLSFFERQTPDEEIERMLRSRYQVRDNGTIEFSSDLLLQEKRDIPLGAVWIQALIDTHRMRNVPGFENATTVREVIENFGKDNYEAFLGEFRKERAALDESSALDDAKVAAVEVPVSKLFFVTPDTDLDDWLKVISRADVEPKGIIVYKHNAVRLENFATKHRGDKMAMSDILRRALPSTDGRIDFEHDILGEEITNEKLAGTKKHVIGEQFLQNRKTLRKTNGKIVVS